MDKIKKSDHFYLIDGSGYIFRAYYALPPLTRKSDGLPVGAVSGFCNMLFKLIEDSNSKDNLQKPTHFAVIFDSARKNFRNEIEYSTKSLNGNPSNGNNPLNGNFFNLPNGLLHKTRGFWKLFFSKIPYMETISCENHIFQGQFIDFPMPILLFLKIQLGRSPMT